MMPPVSLPLNGGTQSARAGAHASIPHTATRLTAPIIRIANSIPPKRTLRRIGRHEKNGWRVDGELSAGVAALHLTSPDLHGTVPSVGTSGGFPMRALFISLKTTGLSRKRGLAAG